MEITREQYRKTFVASLDREMKEMEDKCGNAGLLGLGLLLFASSVVKRMEEEFFSKEEEPAQDECREEDVDVLPFN